MSTTPDALDLFLDDPTFANLLWVTPALFKVTILAEFEDAAAQTFCLVRVLSTALMMVAAVLGVLVLNRTIFLMMMVAASAFGFGVLVVGIWVLVLGYVAMARELAHVEGRGTIIEERRIVKEEGQERSNDSTEERIENLPHYDRRRSSDSTEERTENLPHNNRRRSSDFTEQRIAQVASDTIIVLLGKERSEMKAQMMEMEAELKSIRGV